MQSSSVRTPRPLKAHSIIPIPFKAHKVGSVSAEQLENTFENHYGREVLRLNYLSEQLGALDIAAGSDAKKFSIKESIFRSSNSITLHEAYFNGMGDESEKDSELDPGCQLAEAIENTHGSIAGLMSEIAELLKLEKETCEWVLVVWCGRTSRLLSVCAREQEISLASMHPVLAFNVHGYAYSQDFGENVEKYVSALLRCIHWGRVSKRFDAIYEFQKTTELLGTTDSVTVLELKDRCETPNHPPLVIDVRHTDDCERYRHRITETEWRDSFDVASWSAELPTDKPIVVYCMYGFWVSQDVASELRACGYDARSLVGGINSWRAMGYGTVDY